MINNKEVQNRENSISSVELTPAVTSSSSCNLDYNFFENNSSGNNSFGNNSFDNNPRGDDKKTPSLLIQNAEEIINIFKNKKCGEFRHLQILSDICLDNISEIMLLLLKRNEAERKNSSVIDEPEYFSEYEQEVLQCQKKYTEKEISLKPLNFIWKCLYVSQSRSPTSSYSQDEITENLKKSKNMNVQEVTEKSDDNVYNSNILVCEKYGDHADFPKPLHELDEEEIDNPSSVDSFFSPF